MFALCPSKCNSLKSQLYKPLYANILKISAAALLEKAAEKAEVKGGIHGKLEKAKAEIKAKEADKVPKNKSKDLAAAL